MGILVTLTATTGDRHPGLAGRDVAARMTSKAKRAQYTLEFELEAVRLVKAGQSMAAVAGDTGCG
ncbi:hypothetical protein BCh11DRAFT_07567 [Burkholderia sp. Ch1-1]|nr:hypothetical protein BCh11DRAFT_07567 [Burkholderia sp. Ch1-1]